MSDELYRWPWTGGELVTAEQRIAKWADFFKMKKKEHEMEDSYVGGILGNCEPLPEKANESAALPQAAAELSAPVAELFEAIRNEPVYSADQKATFDEIDRNLGLVLRAELEQERAVAQVSKSHRRDFTRFAASARRLGLPSVPAPAQAVANFLAEELERGISHLSRLRASISRAHIALGYPDPTEDILVRALMRLAKAEPNKSPHKNGNGKGH